MADNNRLIDTHGHLNFEAFTETWEEVANRSWAAGLAAIVMPSAQLPTSRRAIELAKRQPSRLFAAVGLHPTHVPPAGLDPHDPVFHEQKFEQFDADTYTELARAREVVAIGEVGLDTYRTAESLAEQEAVLASFLQIARLINKPVILHCRAAKKPGDPVAGVDPHDRLIEQLDRLADRPRFVVHCYQGSVAQAQRYLAFGGLISFTGTITYSDAPAVADVVRVVPLNRLMLETDSPYLSPVPYRGEPNEPWKVAEVARRVAAIKGTSAEEVIAATTATARHFFGLPGADQ